MVRALTPERLRGETLRRQFPRIRGRGVAAVLELYRRLGPIQTQVPRSAHLTVAGRLPGVSAATVDEAFGAFALVKGTNLRGTVHSALPEHHALAATVSRAPRDLLVANHLQLTRLTPADVDAEIERFCAGEWRERADVVEHVLSWLGEVEGATDGGDKRRTTLGRSLTWGHPGLIRRPPDERWATRTDTLHRTAREVVEQPDVVEDRAVEAMVRLHLGAYGPATRRDVAWWLGGGLRRVDDAVDRLDDEVVRQQGAEGQTYLDLAEPPRGGAADPGTRLLSEFDGLLVGYAGPAHGRFLDEDHLQHVWTRENGRLRSGVLHDGRIVATWRPVARRDGQDIEVTALPGERTLRDDDLADQARAIGAVLGTEVVDIRLLPPDAG